MKFLQQAYHHHSEPTDTELLQWLVGAVDLVFDNNRWIVLVSVSAVLIFFPVLVILLAKYKSR